MVTMHVVVPVLRTAWVQMLVVVLMSRRHRCHHRPLTLIMAAAVAVLVMAVVAAVAVVVAAVVLVVVVVVLLAGRYRSHSRTRRAGRLGSICHRKIHSLERHGECIHLDK